MIRRATTWDGIKILEMWKQMISEVEHLKGNEPDPETFYFQLLVKIKQPNHRVLVTEKDGELIGFITGYQTNAEYSTKPIGFCDNAYVVPEHRGHKVYFKMIKALHDEAVGLGIKEMNFQFRYDLGMVKVWERLGYNPAFIVFRKEV